MRKVISLVLVLVFSVCIFAEGNETAFDKETRLIDASFGFSSLTTPLAVGYEHALTDKLGLNVSALFLSWGYEGTIFGDLNQTLIMPQANINYHFKVKNPKFDVYAGAGLGFSIYSTDWTAETSTGGIFLTGVVGIRYYITKNIAIQARETLVVVGDWGGSYTLLGVTFRL